MDYNFNFNDLDGCSPEELLEELQNLVIHYQNMTPSEKALPATQEDIGASLWFNWAVLKTIIDSK